MKKTLLLAITFSLMAVVSQAQLAPGSALPANITGSDVLTDEAVDVQAWLDDGKFVVIDVFATWCPPCWDFHTSGWLDDMNERYGPEGTDQIRILGVEADASTAESLLYMAVNGGSNATTSLGNWTQDPATGENITYSMIQNPAAASTLSIGYWPSLYMIQPSGSLVELGTLVPNPRTDEEFWLNALGISGVASTRLGGELGFSDFCFELTTEDAEVSIFNASAVEIASASFEVMINGATVGTYEYDGDPIMPFLTGTITIPGLTITEASDVEINVVSINGEEGEYGEITARAGKYELVTKQFTLLFTTDQYALETSWVVTDDNGNELDSFGPYASGPDQFGGGGADANTTHEYVINVPADATCLTFTINDSYGDGMGTVTQQHATMDTPPGVEILDQWGNEVKTNIIVVENNTLTELTGEGYNWGSTIDILVNTEMTTGVEAITELEGSKVYPNPVSETLNVELNFSEVTDYNVTINDIYGKTVRALGNFSNTQLNSQYDVSDLASGMYFITVKSDNGQNTMKFTKS